MLIKMCMEVVNLVPRVLSSLASGRSPMGSCQRLVARRESEVQEFYYCRISADNASLTGQPIKNFNFFKLTGGSPTWHSTMEYIPSPAPGDQPLAKEPEDAGYETGPSREEIWERNTAIATHVRKITWPKDRVKRCRAKRRTRNRLKLFQ